MSQANSEIVFSKEWSLVHYSCSVAVCDILVRHYSEGTRCFAAILTMLLEVLEIAEQGLVGLSNQLLALTLAQNLHRQRS